MKKTIAMIPAAGRGSRMLSLTKDMPKAMLPLRNKPIIGWHLDKLINEGINKICIIVGYKKEKLINYVNQFYGDKIDLTYVEQIELKGLAHAIHLGIEELDKKYLTKIDSYKLLIILGDTIIKDNFKEKFSKNSFIGYHNVNDYKRWCLLKTDNNNNIMKFVDKPDYDPNTRKSVIGIYYFEDIIHLNNNIKEIIKENIKIKGEYQLSSAMELYMKKYTLEAVEFEQWFDCGEVSTFNKTRQNITRHFNSIDVTDSNTIIKKSENENKIQQEINWYLNIPNKLRVYIPQLIDYSILPNKTFYELEYVNFTPMQELFLYNLPDIPEWEKFFNNIFKIIERMNLYSTRARFNTKEHLKEMLNNKTQKRIDILINQNNIWKEILNYESIRINGKLYKNYPLLIDQIFNYVNQNIIPNSASFWQVIHGDLFFGNMLYDANSDTLKIIDPRGNFGLDGIYGDIRYDIAKLNHSILGKYDFIVNSLYAITREENNNFEYILYDCDDHMKVDKLFIKYLINNNFNYEDILVITGLLFLSMIPLHSENINNQKMFYFKAIEIFNKIF
ncbi:MAG: sugar phosphate nucleotidyltransferase [archaeon]